MMIFTRRERFREIQEAYDTLLMPKEEEFMDQSLGKFLRSQKSVLPPKIKNFPRHCSKTEKGRKLQFIGKRMMQIW